MVQAIENGLQKGAGLASTFFKAAVLTGGLMTLSTVAAASTGGLSIAVDPTLTATAATKAGTSIATATAAPISGTGYLSMMGQGVAHNLHGAGDAISGWITPEAQ